MEYKSEAHLQSLCTKWFRSTYPLQWYRLFLIYNNAPNIAMAGLLKSMGMQPGISDQLYFTPMMTLLWIEYKLPGKTQSDAQIDFEKLVRNYGFNYVIIDNEDMFKIVIKTYNKNE